NVVRDSIYKNPVAARALRDDHDELRPGPRGQEQAADAARPVAVPGRSAPRGTARPAGDRRSAEPRPGGARGAADALESRDREIEAAADRDGRAAEPARQAGRPRARAAAPADHGELSPAAARRR